MKAFVELASCSFVAFLATPCILYPLVRLFRCVGRSALGRQTRAVVLALAVVATIATIKAQKRSGTGTTGVPPVESGTTGTTGVLPVANPVTNTLHFSSISVPTSGTVMLTAAWPESFLATGQTLDVLGKENLHDVTWTWVTNGIITAGATNISWTLENQSPSNHFYKIIVRDSLTDMDDPDGDGMPNVYELANGTNPFVSDYASAPKIVAGGSGADGVADLASAFATSGEYSIIEVASGIHSGSGWTGLHLPAYPVMITSSDGGRGRAATLRHVAQMAAFYLSATQRTDTVVQGLNIDLVASSGQQMGFWCGGDLPWSGLPAAGTFRNISMRMPNPGVQYFGWFFRHWESNEAVIAASAINASGATDVRGIYAIDSPPMSVENCTFANFPPAGGGTLGYGIQYESTPANWGNAPDVIPIEIVNCLFDVSFMNAHALAPLEQGVSYDVTMWNCIVPSPLMYLPDHEYGTIVTNALTAWSGHLLADSPAIGAGTDVLHSSYDLDGQPRDECPDIGADEYAPDVMGDADGDGLSDSYEIENGIDPYRADSDFDGVDDAREITDETNPIDPHSFTQTLTVTVTNTASTACTVYTAWGYSADGWETNEQKTFPNGFGVTNYTNASSQGATHVKAFCDLNGNATFDADYDILRVRSIPPGSTARVDFVFGDVDGDGADDIAERVAGSDPYSSLSCLVTRTIQVSDSDKNSNVTNQLWISQSPLTSDVICQVSFGKTLTTNVSAVATNGTLYVIVTRDLNRNGIYDEGVDPVVTRLLANAGSALAIMIGDADGDGVVDSSEYASGTDHFDRDNFRFNTRVFFESMDRTPSLTNYVQATIDNATWDGLRGQVFLGCVSENLPVAGVTTGGVFYAKYFRDVNCNGVYDEGVDIFSAIRFGHGANSAAGGSRGILIGDCDSDGVPDSEELASGTDPSNGLDFRFNLDLTVGGVFATSNNLTAVVLVDGMAATSPCVVTGRSFACSLTNLCPHTGSGVAVRFWDDANQNGILDAGEKFTDQRIVADGTNTVVYCRLPLGTFDTDKDGMPDYWELQNGLSSLDPTDALEDPDADGLINLHEYMAGCDVWEFDGIGTALYAFCHAIDDRIRGFEMLPGEVYPEDQFGWTAQFGAERNVNCWAYGIDISSASPWNSSEWGLKAGTAISRRHIIFAHHYQIPPGNTIKFIGVDNTTNIFTIVANKSLAGTDITIGLLSGDLPESVAPANILPPDYCRFIGDARRLPMLFIDNEENANISDSNSLPYREMDSDGLVPVDVYRQLYFEEVISGDSGGPKYFVCNNAAILACALYTYGTGSSGRGPFVTYYRKRIQAVMDELCPGYTLREFDLSTFRSLDDED